MTFKPVGKARNLPANVLDKTSRLILANALLQKGVGAEAYPAGLPA